jgi:hypothetical protein
VKAVGKNMNPAHFEGHKEFIRPVVRCSYKGGR